MWLAASFVVLGFLVGNLVGLSAESVVTSVLGLLFAFAGGSVIALLRKLSVDDRRIAGQALFGISLGCLIGVYAGIAVSEYQLLSPRPSIGVAADSAEAQRVSIEARKYLRTSVLQAASAIDGRYTTGALACPSAYRELLGLLQDAAPGP